MQFSKPSMADLGIAAGLVAIALFGILFATIGHAAALVVGCGGGALLAVVSLLARRRSA